MEIKAIELLKSLVELEDKFEKEYSDTHFDSRKKDYYKGAIETINTIKNCLIDLMHENS